MKTKEENKKTQKREKDGTWYVRGVRVGVKAVVSYMDSSYTNYLTHNVYNLKISLESANITENKI